MHEKLQHALSLHRQGRLGPAQALYEDILSVQPEHAEALHFAGLIALQAGQPSRAVELIGKAIRLDPGNALALFNRGSAWQALRQWDAALRDYDSAIEIKGDFAEAFCNRSTVHMALGQLDAALTSANRAIALKNGFAEAYFNRGVVEQELGQWAAALEDLDRAIALRANYAEALSNRGNVQEKLEQYAAALASYDQAIAVRADSAVAHLNRGNLLAKLERPEAALADYDEAVAIAPNFAPAYSNRGNVLALLKRWDAALASYEHAIALDAEFAEAHFNKGNSLRQLDRADAALASYDRAIALRPDYAEALCNKGLVLAECNRLDEAAAHYDEAIRIRPDYSQALYNRSFTALLRGDLENGWREHECRFDQVDGASSEEQRRFAAPRWRGEESVASKTLLLYAEQGFGDTLQFCRYAGMAARLGARVVLEVPPPLASLLKSLEGVAQVLARGEPLPRFDYACPLLSLPLAFKTTLATIPAAVPYLHANAEKIHHWREKLGKPTKLRVGLVWSGGFRPDQPERRPLNRRRNIPLAGLVPLEHPEIEFYTLQKGQPAESELADTIARSWNGPHLIDHTALLQDFSDTAAIMMNLDLLISVDTSTAHLAGALGKPVWILNRFDTCWRWMLNRSDSPWYPTVRLYRQDRPGDWDGVVERVRADLDQMAAAHGISRRL